MLTTLTAAAAPLAFHGPGVGGPGAGGFGWLFLLVPLVWVTFFVLLFTFLGRRWRRFGPWQAQGALPEQTLGDRYARGEIDEQEYRSRLEVLRTQQQRRR